uniref:Uncharacterized protein n=1 Tax=Arundo donax TaxID=35708 RepID=A0A0A8Z4Q2_ARUDO
MCTSKGHTRQPFTPTTNEAGDLPLLLRRWSSTRYSTQPLSVSGCHPLTSLSGFEVSVSQFLISGYVLLPSSLSNQLSFDGVDDRHRLENMRGNGWNGVRQQLAQVETAKTMA